MSVLRFWWCVAGVTTAAAVWAMAQPATKPTNEFDRLLGPDSAETQKPITPVGKPVNPPAATGLLREGTILVDRVGRLAKASDGNGWEFVFESDGRALMDPPVRVHENLKLMAMEEAIEGNTRDLLFRITGSLTEYRGKNYVLFEKVVVVPDAARP
jgi:hypothetical protein